MVVRDRSCSLRARVTGLQARSVAFCNAIESREFSLRGVIQEPYYDGPGPDHSDPRFNQKEISVLFRAPDNGEVLREIKQREAADHALGKVVVERDVASRSWTVDDGEPVVVPPVHAYLWVSTSAIGSFQYLVEAQQAPHDLEIELRLGGSSISRCTSSGSIFLKDLDVSEQREYAVVFVGMWDWKSR